MITESPQSMYTMMSMTFHHTPHQSTSCMDGTSQPPFVLHLISGPQWRVRARSKVNMREGARELTHTSTHAASTGQ